MSETTETNISNDDDKSEETINTNNPDNPDNEGFPVFIILILLAVIWMISNFTVFICMIVMVLMSKIATIRNSNATRNNDETNASLSPPIRMKCSSTMTDDTIFQSLTTKSESESDIDDEQRETPSLQTEQERTDDDFIGQDADPIDLRKTVKQMPEKDVEKIDKLIHNKGTVAVLITASAGTVRAVPTTIDVGVSATPSENPTIRKSAFVTESVMKIAVSYSGKERKRVLKITRFLRDHMKASENPDAVFFDRDFQHEICRINGLSHLQNIYSQAHLVTVFLSPTYTDSRYCSGEWRTIADRFLSDRKNKEATQLLLIKLGEYEMKQLDLVNNDFAVNGLRMSNKEIAALIFDRWKIIEENLKQNNQ